MKVIIVTIVLVLLPIGWSVRGETEWTPTGWYANFWYSTSGLKKVMEEVESGRRRLDTLSIVIIEYNGMLRKTAALVADSLLTANTASGFNYVMYSFGEHEVVACFGGKYKVVAFSGWMSLERFLLFHENAKRIADSMTAEMNWE